MNLNFRARSALAATFASTALLVCAAPALAAPPANDNLADAQPIGPALPVTVDGTTVDATAEPGEPAPTFLAQPFNSVWYALDVPAEGDYANIVTVSACGESLSNDYIDVYSVSGPGFDGLDRQERFFSNSGACSFTFVVTEGTQYRIVVDRANDGGAPHELSVAEWTPSPNAPANDDFENAQEIGPELPIEGVEGSNYDASPEIGEPSHGNLGEAYQSVWYALDVPAEDYPDIVTVNTCQEFGGGNNTVGVYAVEGEGFAGLAEVDPAADENNCAFTFAPIEGTDYRIAVDNIYGGEDFDLSVLANDPPPNDNFEDRQVIPSVLPQELPGTNADATAEEDEPQHASGRDPSKSVWYEWTTDVDMPVKIDVCDADTGAPFQFSPNIAVYADESEEEGGARAAEGPALVNLHRIATTGNNDDCTLTFTRPGGGGGARAAAPPVTLFIAIDSPAEADFNLKLRTSNAPANDDISDREVIPSSLPQTVQGSTVDSSAEEDEPEHSNSDARRSVWYEWTSDATDPVTVEVCDQDFEEVGIAVYVDESGGGGGGPFRAADTPEMHDLGEIASNNGRGCTVTFDPAASPEGGGMRRAEDPRTFFIAFDSGFDEGEFTLLLRAANPPPNDDFADAIAVGPGLPVSEDGDTIESSREEGEPEHGSAGSVWYSWTPDTTQTVVINTCASEGFNSTIGVYTGSQLDSLSDADGGDESCPAGPGRKFIFNATAGTEYMIAIAGFSGEGTFTLEIKVPGMAPAMPTVTGVSPASGSNENEPRVIGTAEAGSTVYVFTEPTCSTDPFWTGSAAQFASPGIGVEVDDDSTTTFYAFASNSDGVSACSTTSVSYSEVTPQVPPAAPSFTGSSPGSGANDNNPEIRGTAEPGSTVRLYTNASCTGPVAATGTAAQFAAPGLTVTVPDNSTTAFYATAQNAYGTSPCSSSSLSYQEVSGTTPPSGGQQPANPTPPVQPGPTTKKCPKGKKLKNGKCVKKKAPRKK